MSFFLQFCFQMMIGKTRRKCSLAHSFSSLHITPHTYSIVYSFIIHPLHLKKAFLVEVGETGGSDGGGSVFPGGRGEELVRMDG